MGSPAAFKFSIKDIGLPTSTQKLSELLIFNKALSGVELNALSRYLAKVSKVEGVVFDPSLMNDGNGGASEAPAASPQFLAAKAIIDAKCLSCHTSAGIGDFRNLTQNQYIQKGFIVPKNLSTSKMYYRLAGVSVGSGPADMPIGGAGALPAAEIQAIADWINSIQ